VGTHVLKVKNVGTVELNGQPAPTHAGPISSTTTCTHVLNVKNVGAVELTGQKSTVPVELKNPRS
jgi:archaellum component FlaG (FlaF/FlaG flagellin family)